MAYQLSSFEYLLLIMRMNANPDYTPHIGEKGLWTVLLGDGITRADHVLLHIINILKSQEGLFLFSSIVKILILNKRYLSEVVPWHTETLPIRVSGFHLAGTKHLL